MTFQLHLLSLNPAGLFTWTHTLSRKRLLARTSKISLLYLLYHQLNCSYRKTTEKEKFRVRNTTIRNAATSRRSHPGTQIKIFRKVWHTPLQWTECLNLYDIVRSFFPEQRIWTPAALRTSLFPSKVTSIDADNIANGWMTSCEQICQKPI